jgi:hypothetical protein
MLNQHCQLAILALALSPLAAPAEDKPLIVDRSRIDNRFIFAAGTHTIAAPLVIPRTDGPADGTFPYTNPAREICGVHGLGATTSILSANIASGPFISTEGHGKSSVYTAEVTGLTLKGPDSHDMGQFAFHAPGNPPADYITTGIALDAVESIVANCQVRLVRGYGVTMGQSTPPSGYYLSEYRVESCRFVHCYTAILARTDGRYFNNIVSNCRDYCLYLPKHAGAVQSVGNHFYGAQKAIYAVDAEGLHSTNDVFSDAGYGLHLAGYSHYALVTGGYSQHCWVRNIDAESNYNSFVNCSVRVMRNNDQHPGIVGVELAARGNQFLGGQVYTSAYTNPGDTNNTVPTGCTAFLITNDGYGGTSGDNRIETVVFSPTGVGGSGDDDVCVRFADASTGNQIDITIPYGFAHTDSRLLVVDAAAQAGLKGNTITFRGPGLQAAVATPAAYVDIGAGGIDATNTVKIIDSDTGKSVTLTPGQSY